MNVGFVPTDAYVFSLSVINTSLKSLCNYTFVDGTFLFYPLDLMHVLTFLCFLFYNTQCYFIKVFLDASIVCIFYEHFVILVCTLTRFIRGNEIKQKTFYVSCFSC